MSRYCEQGLGKMLGLLLVACMVFAAVGYADNASAAVRVSAGFSYNTGGYDLLAEYGDWMRVQPYGVVWCPYVDADWAPFYDGRWIWTSYGWAWDSYEPFGELVYHYGYWYFDNDIGWFWMPGNEWSPARVQWYSYGSYCGWAPMPPPHYYWPDPWDYYDFNIWIVVHIDNLCNDHIGRHGIDRPRYRDVFHRGDVAKRAPDIRKVRTLAGREIPVRTIEQRPMDIRTDKIKAAERVTAQRTARSSGVERTVAIERRSAQTERRVVQPQRQAVQPRLKTVQPQRQAVQPERKTVEPQRRVAQPERTTVQSQRHVFASKQAARVERKSEPAAKSARATESRKAESSSERPVKKTTKR